MISQVNIHYSPPLFFIMCKHQIFIISDCVKQLKDLYEETEIPVDDDNQIFHRLCEKLEFLLFVGLNGMKYNYS